LPNHVLRAAGAAAILSLGLVGCTPAAEGATSEVAVTVGVMPGADLAPLYLGLEQGFFRAQGIDLTIDSLAPSISGIVSAVEAGSYDFGYADILSILIAAEDGADIEIVSGATATSGNKLGDFTALMVPADSEVTSVADLVGRTIAVDTVGTTNHVVLSAVLEAEGVDADSITWETVSLLDSTAALADGSVDAALVVEPFATAAKIDGMRAITYPFAEFSENLTVSGYFTSRAFAEGETDVEGRFVAALAQSLQYATEHETETRDHIAAVLAAQSDVRTRVQMPTFAAEIDRTALERLAGAAVESGVLGAVPAFDEVLPVSD
jgi:NitT/TauT family transport system substrate-binding protein